MLPSWCNNINSLDTLLLPGASLICCESVQLVFGLLCLLRELSYVMSNKELLHLCAHVFHKPRMKEMWLLLGFINHSKILNQCVVHETIAVFVYFHVNS
jgi:hypothetical protein